MKKQSGGILLRIKCGRSICPDKYSNKAVAVCHYVLWLFNGRVLPINFSSDAHTGPFLEQEVDAKSSAVMWTSVSCLHSGIFLHP